MFDHQQFRELIIRPVLNELGLFHEVGPDEAKNAEELLIATMAYESKGGTYLKQEHGPALGPYEMEPKTYIGVIHHLLGEKDKKLFIRMVGMFGSELIPEFKTARLEADISAIPPPTLEEIANNMIWNLKYATAIARIFYLTVEEALPPADDIEKIWEYYKKYWNTEEGKTRKDHFIEDYNIFTKKKVL